MELTTYNKMDSTSAVLGGEEQPSNAIRALSVENRKMARKVEVLQRFIDDTADMTARERVNSELDSAIEEEIDANEAVREVSLTLNETDRASLTAESGVKKVTMASPTHSEMSSVTLSSRFSKWSSSRALKNESHNTYCGRRNRKKLGETFESFDYDASDDSFMYNGQREKAVVEKENRRRNFFRWFYVVVIAFLVGAIAYWMTFAVGRIVYAKYDSVFSRLHKGDNLGAYLTYLAWVNGMIFPAALFVVWAPESAGSGIPQVKAFLNGNQVPGILRMQTLIAKVLGITLCVSSGMPAGREGPMVHTGAILSAGFARGYSDYIPCLPAMYQGFDNPKDRRDFVSMGAAAGVAAAFNAPIGGILFSLEEVSSFWSPSLTWQSFICAIVAAYTVNLFMSVALEGNFNDDGLVLFSPKGEEDASAVYVWWEIFMFILIAILGGLVGSAYVWVNEHITMWRKKVWKGKHPMWRVFEACGVVSLIMTALYFLPVAFDCVEEPHFDDASHHTGFHGLNTVRYTCAEGFYNQMATLSLTPQETTILQLYSRETAGFFSISVLITFTAAYFVCAVTAYGLAVPAGLFIPSMMIGASMGRLVGELLYLWQPDVVDPGLYALVGASAVLGGITRMTISLTVIMVEVSNDINFLLPIMLALAVSKLVGDQFTHSLYDVHMDLANIPYLEPDPPQVFEALSAESIMARDVVMLGAEATVEAIEAALETKHNAFPVVDVGQAGLNRFFCGMITRAHLDLLLIKSREESRLNKTVDLTVSMDPTPFIVQSQLSLRRVLRLFRGMGLRHLCVVDARQRVVGIITRKDFINSPLTVDKAMNDARFVKSTRVAMNRMARSSRIKGANANAPLQLKRSNSFVGIL